MTYDIKAIKKNAEHLGNAYFDDKDKLLLINHSTLLKHNQYEVIKYEDIMYCYVDESDGVQTTNHSLGYATLGAMVGGFFGAMVGVAAGKQQRKVITGIQVQVMTTDQKEHYIDCVKLPDAKLNDIHYSTGQAVGSKVEEIIQNNL